MDEGIAALKPHPARNAKNDEYWTGVSAAEIPMTPVHRRPDVTCSVKTTSNVPSRERYGLDRSRFIHLLCPSTLEENENTEDVKRIFGMGSSVQVWLYYVKAKLVVD
jgi:hypothetical protein